MANKSRMRLAWFVVAVCSTRNNAWSFQIRNQCSRIRSSVFELPPSMPTRDTSSRETLTDADEKMQERSNRAELVFVAEIHTKSGPLPYDSRDDVISFFKCPKNRNLFVTAAGKREYNILPMSSQILQDWTKLCEQEGKILPSEDDEVFKVKTGGIRFPGLTLETSAIMGIKLIEDDAGPRYQVTLIGDERKVKGLPPVEYIFNKLTGGDSESGSTSNLSTTNIICDFTEEASKVVFKTDTLLTIHVKFPAILLKLLPTGKEKAEEQGSQAIYKTVAKDVEASMVAFEEEYLQFLSLSQAGI